MFNLNLGGGRIQNIDGDYVEGKDSATQSKQAKKSAKTEGSSPKNHNVYIGGKVIGGDVVNGQPIDL